MKKTLLTIALSAWMLNTYAQVVGEESTSQSVASLFEEKPKEEKKKPEKSLTLSFGPAWITSKIYTSRDVYTNQAGMEIMAEFDCVYSNCLGFGLSFNHNFTNYPYDSKLYQFFLGPSFVYAGYIGERWWAKVDLGIGYAMCDDTFEKQSGLGTKSGISFNYMVSPKIGVGIHMRALSSIFGKQSVSYPGSENDANGIARFGVTIGMRFNL